MATPVVLITGALTGIGRATALAFANEGARVIVSGRRDEDGEKLVAELRKAGAEADFVRSDVRHEDRKENRDPEVSKKVAPAQIAALEKWGAARKAPYAYLKSIKQPTLVVNGGNDVIIYTVNSFILQQNLPNAQLILYPGANHGSQYQYPQLFVEHVTLFLNA